MAYIWRGSKAPEYLTAIREVCYIDSETAKSLKNGSLISSKILTYIIKDNKRVSKDKFYEWDVLDDTIGVPLVNQKVLDILERECSGKFQAIPAIIKLPDGEKVKDYFAINVINKIPIASLENCIKKNEYKNDNNIRGFIFSCKAYNANTIDQEDLCKDSIIEPASLIFLSERLRNIFIKEKVKSLEVYKNLRDSVILV